METRASHVLVGLFVVVLAVTAAGFAVWLASARLDREVDVYEVVFRSSVSGLQNGAQVTYQGIQVGRVTRIRFDPDDVEHVLVRVEVEPTTPVTEDTTARLEPQGITGIFFVQLSGGTNRSARLESRPNEPAQIPGRPSTIDRLTADAPEILNRSVTLLERATALLAEDNLERIAATLDNLEQITTALADPKAGIGPLVEDANRLVVELQTTAETVNATSDDLERLVATLDSKAGTLLDTGTSTFAELGEAASGIDQAAAQMNAMLGDVRQPLRDFSQGGLYEFSALIGETRQLVATASRITRELERDPAGFLLGGSFKGFQAD